MMKKLFFKFSNSFFRILVFGLTFAWLYWGYFLFTSDKWSLGEPGDFVSGATIFLIIYVTALQLYQMDKQDQENMDATLLRSYEVLKPEIEGAAAQVVSKLYESQLVDFSGTGTDMATLNEKFLKDRTVFLRELQKSSYANALTLAVTNSKYGDAKRCITRLTELTVAVVGEDGKGQSHDDVRGQFLAALKQTDVYLAYRAIKEAAAPDSF